MNQLSLEWSSTTVTLGPSPSQVDYLDFHVDGQSLLDWIRWLQGEEHVPRGMVSCFARCFDRRAIKLAYEQMVLQSSPPLTSRRVPVYVCPCGDLGCACITVAVARRGETVSWSELGIGDEACFPDVPAFSFDWVSYRTVLATGRGA